MYNYFIFLSTLCIVSLFNFVCLNVCVGGIFLICSFLMINNVKHLFIIHLLLFGEVSVQIFCSFKKLEVLGEFLLLRKRLFFIIK